ncbi:GH39 family glycosyl hydrolase [Thermoanaerobacterium thermosaccharolyticum]|uniref:Beta-xylosidase n=1 Tax=Thermoanaerobacterium thermosaccharolyticum M0795 TaxID=698948 RepID=L0IK28_THETR|nr:beta-xylosidase [Thermoanaerobacterium thermosaccharolyticum]AGB18606.1 beta-xylosidase [Thermoanaerobacterium thermosaccharolyticum M0795]
MVKIKIPKNSDGKKFTSRWRYCVGTGRLGLALQKEYIDTLKFVKENIDFKYIRGHGLLCDDVGIYREDVVGNDTRPFYNFTYIDRIFDSFLELGIRPFVEVGFMPKKLASGTQTVFYWEGNVTPPKDYEKWSNLVKAVVSHFISRYGIDEVLKWPFEIWNEPNLKEFWKDADQKEYFKLYKVTAKAIKEVNENLQVGGPAICGGSDYWIEDFLNFCHEESVPVDFVSRHAYTSKQGEYTPHLIYQEIMPPTYMLDEFKKVREMIRNSPFPNLPFHITEYNTSYSPLNPVHDTPFNAAYLARILSEGGDYVDSFSYWTFSDVFEEKDVPRSQFHGGFGLVALNKIPKPTFHMFKFFNSMGEEVLYRDEHMLVTRRDDGSVALIAWNEIMEKTENPDKEYDLEIPIGFKDVFIKKQMIDEDHGNPWGTWIHMGRPRFPSKEQIRTLRDIARPEIKTGKVTSDDGYINLKFKLEKNAVALFELTEVIDESSTYIGLDDSKINGY